MWMTNQTFVFSAFPLITYKPHTKKQTLVGAIHKPHNRGGAPALLIFFMCASVRRFTVTASVDALRVPHIIRVRSVRAPAAAAIRLTRRAPTTGAARGRYTIVHNIMHHFVSTEMSHTPLTSTSNKHSPHRQPRPVQRPEGVLRPLPRPPPRRRIAGESE